MKNGWRLAVFLAGLCAARELAGCPLPTVDWTPNPVCVGCESVLALGNAEVAGYQTNGLPWVESIFIMPTGGLTPVAGGNIDTNTADGVIDWSEPGYCSVVVTSKLDWVCLTNDPPTYGTSTNVVTTDFIVARMETLTLAEAGNTNNSRQDTTNDDGTPTNNTLVICEDTNGTAQVVIDLSWTPTNASANAVGKVFAWGIEGSGWTPGTGDFSGGAVTAAWSNAGGAVDRDFTLVSQCNCGAGGNCEECPYRRMLKIAVLKVEFVHAEGDNVGEPMGHLPIFTTNCGVHAGVPIYDCPDADLTLEFSGALNSSNEDSITVTYLGTQYTVTETGTNTLTFTKEDFSVAISEAPLADTNVEESLTTTVTLPSYGITNAVYPCTETLASSLVFDNDLYGIILLLSDLATNTIDTMQITINSLIGYNEWNLTETSTNSLYFTGSNLAVRLINNPTLTSNSDTLYASIFGSQGLSNIVFRVYETESNSKVFRNFDEAVPTSITNVPVPSFVPWKVKIYGISDSNIVTSFALRTSIDTNSQISFFTVASLLSDQKFIMVPASVNTEYIQEDYKVLKVDDAAIDWGDDASLEVSADIQILAMATPATAVQKKAQPGAVVLESLSWIRSALEGLDTEGRIRAPLLQMGYSTIRDYHASVNNTLTKYIKGKQVWYSMSHGGTEDGTTYSPFNGLGFKDGSIKASDLQGLELKYRLVIVDACASAQTSIFSMDDAIENNTLTSGARAFAETFGPDAAYMGWGWKMGAEGAQFWSSKFVENLKYVESLGRGRTVQEAYDKFIQDYYKPPSAAKLMKIYRNTGNIIDLRTSN